MKYTKPQVEIIVLDDECVITSSLVNGGQGPDEEIELPGL